MDLSVIQTNSTTHLALTPGQRTGLIFDIRRYSVHDGPGIRTAVFFKGCPLSCWWCHNPEGRSAAASLMLFPDRCLACGKCMEVCPQGAILREDGVVRTSLLHCQACGTCIDACPADARNLAGRHLSVAEVLEEIEKDCVFYEESGGGVTFTGGEPMSQPQFLEALLAACAERRIHTVVDTCGYADKEVILRLSDKIDLFLFDLKSLDPNPHEKHTGVSNARILENLQALAHLGKPIIVRFPVIPGINDMRDHIYRMISYLCGLGLNRIDLLPYHRIGIEKYQRLGMPYLLEGLEPPTEAHIREIAREFEQRGFAVRMGG